MLAASASVSNRIAVSVFFISIALLNRHMPSKPHAMSGYLDNKLFLKGNSDVLSDAKFFRSEEKWTASA